MVDLIKRTWNRIGMTLMRMFGFQWQCEQTGKQVMVRLYVVFDHVDDRVAITNWMNKCPAAHADIIDVVTEDDEEVPFHGFDIDWEDLK